MKKLLFCILALFPMIAWAKEGGDSRFFTQIAALENAEGGQIGVAAINTENGQYLAYRGDERFAMCSTHKLLLVAAVLSRVDVRKEQLDRLVEFSQADIQAYAPIVKQHLNERKMSIAALSAAAIEYSDNTAANLLLHTIGGPEALTGYIRLLGDKVTRLDRNEPTLNENIANDLRDTTTPLSMVGTMQKLLIGNALSPASKEQLISWLLGNTTGAKKLRAGVNPSWKVGDKTGSGENGASSDVAIIWPTNKKPFLVAVYYSGAKTSADKRSEVIARVGQIVSESFYP